MNSNNNDMTTIVHDDGTVQIVNVRAVARQAYCSLLTKDTDKPLLDMILRQLDNGADVGAVSQLVVDIVQRANLVAGGQ